MNSTDRSLRFVRFGLFEVDLLASELRKQGRKIKLQEQPFQALMLLLERPGEVVTREELRERLWPENTFVDFDRGLNKAINGLRVALRDQAKRPNFIETLSRTGDIALSRQLHPLRTWRKCAIAFCHNTSRGLAPWQCYLSITSPVIPRRNTFPTA